MLVYRINFKILIKHKNCLLNSTILNRYYSTFYDEKIPHSDESGYKTVPHYSEKSALFTKTNSAFPRLINPELNLENIFISKDINESGLFLNLNARDNQLDLQRLKDDYFKMIKLEKKIKQLNLEKDKISNKVNNLVKSTRSKKKMSETEEFKKLVIAGNDLKAQINFINEKLMPLSEIVKIACIRLPNSLHASSLVSNLGNYDQTTDLSLNVIFSFNDDYRQYKKCSINWRHIFKKNKEWSFIENSSTLDSLNAKYYVGEYARLENAIINYVRDKIEFLNDLKSSSLTYSAFEHIKSSSMFKTAVIEGCGQNINDQREIINIIEFGNTESSNIDLLHLTGLCSLNALVLDFIRTKIKKNYLPWTVYTNGRNYSPQKGQLNRFDFLSLCADSSQYLMSNNLNDKCKLKINLEGKKYIDIIKNELTNNYKKLFEETHNKIDNLFIDHLKLFVYIFKEFNLPIRFRLLSANQLATSESLKVLVESYLPSEHKFLNIGEVCLLNDYVSERLQIRLDDPYENELKHVSMIYTNLIDINLFMQLLVESNMDSNFKFVLPNILKKYF